MKTSKKVIALILAAIMILPNIAGFGKFDLGIDFSVKADAADTELKTFNPKITIGGVTQQRVVDTSNNAYKETYAGYQEQLFAGVNSNSPTNFVIPGLSKEDDYVVQGMAYWAEMDWFLITAYDADKTDEVTKNSVIMAVDAKTAEFVALYNIFNADGSINIGHGGGIAVSDHNLYYTNEDKNAILTYIDLDQLRFSDPSEYAATVNSDGSKTRNSVKSVYIDGEMDLVGDLNGVWTAYCCIDEGVLWTGNFYRKDSEWPNKFADAYPSALIGYRLSGNSSAEEWHNLQNRENFMFVKDTSSKTVNGSTYSITTTDADGNSTTTEYTQNMTYNAAVSIAQPSGAQNITISGNINNVANATTKDSEFVSEFASVTLVEGKQYTVEFTSTNANTDMFMFAPNGTHCNVAPAGITDNGNGTYTYKLAFTAGLKPSVTGIDSTWPTTQSADGTYSGRYTIRFDQDNPTTDYSFTISNIKLTLNSSAKPVNCSGNPTYSLATDVDHIQYGVVHQGKFYISRSYQRNGAVRELVIGEMDLNVPPETTLNVNGSNRQCYLIQRNSDTTIFANDNMLYMSEAVCIVDDSIYMNAESACWKYNGADNYVVYTNKCPKPIDILWKIDIKKLLNEYENIDTAKASHYEKITDLSQINAKDEYIIAYESDELNPVTQDNILYAIDSFGGYKNSELPKQNSIDQALLGDSMGVVGYKIDDYALTVMPEGDDLLYIDEDVDARYSIRWGISYTNDGNLRISNKSPYFGTNKNLTISNRQITMSSANFGSVLNNMKLEAYTGEGAEPGDFRLYYQGDNKYYLWCNDGLNRIINQEYKNQYTDHGITAYKPVYDDCVEIAGTFHCDGDFAANDVAASGNLTGAPVAIDNQIIHIYKRVRDEFSSVVDSRIYTDTRAELQADGTYNITLETYAINERPYVILDNERPTDYVFVLDTSGSMKNADNYQLVSYDHTRSGDIDSTHKKGTGLSMADLTGNSDIATSSVVAGYNASNPVYFQHSDGKFYQLYATVERMQVDDGVFKTFYNMAWVWYTTDEGITYYLNKGIYDEGFTDDGYGGYLCTWIEERPEYSIKTRTTGTSSDRLTDMVMHIPHWVPDGADGTAQTRLQGMQEVVTAFIDDIKAHTTSTLDHRIAVVQFGSNADDIKSVTEQDAEGCDINVDYKTPWLNTGMYATDSTSLHNYGDATINGSGAVNDLTQYYKTAFFDVSNDTHVNNLKTIINNLTVDQYDPDTYSNYGFEMANGILANSTYNGETVSYFSDGSRSAAIIFITDGMPGKGGTDYTTADTVANLTIDQAHIAKADNGAYVYSVQFGDNSAYGNMDEYIDYVSSEYPAATSLSFAGDRDISDITYSYSTLLNEATRSQVINSTLTQMNNNSKHAVSKLDGASILREQLSDTFVITDDTTVTVETSTGQYDQLQRLQFEAPVATNEFTVDKSTLSDNILTITGFDYETEYISFARTYEGYPGRKLIVHINGVLANSSLDTIGNVSINNTSTTAIYETKEKMDNGIAVTYFPTENFTIPEYTYVLDYDMDMLDTDVNGEPLAISPDLSKQDINNYNKSLTEAYADRGQSLAGVDLAIQNTNGVGDNLLYSLSGNENGNDADNKGYVLIKRPDGSYDWFRINIVPASNVMYEETKITSPGGKVVNWANTSGEGGAFITTQSLATDADVYGYEPQYEDRGNGVHSNNTVKEVTVDSTNKRSDVATFTFKGTGFDLISACGSNTGALYVAVKDANNKLVDFSIIDTYYNDTYGPLTQVPVASFKNLDYGTYSVGVSGYYLSSSQSVKPKSSALSLFGNGTNLATSSATVDYTDIASAEVDDFLDEFNVKSTKGVDEAKVVWMDDNSILNGGTGAQSAGLSRAVAGGGNTSLVCYLDGVRIYNPMDYGYSEYLASEQNAKYYNISESLKTTGEQVTGDTNYFGYVEGGVNDGSITFADYINSAAPKNEVYLANGNQALTFNVQGLSDNSKVMVSLRAVSGLPKAKFGASEIEITSASEMYYNITDFGTKTTDDNGNVTITYVVENSGDGLLAVNNVKITSGSVVSTSEEALPAVASLMSLDAVTVEANAPVYASKYPNYVPSEPVRETDPYITGKSDGVTDTPIEPVEPETPDNDFGFDIENEFVASIIQMIFEILQKIFTLFAA